MITCYPVPWEFPAGIEPPTLVRLCGRGGGFCTELPSPSHAVRLPAPRTGASSVSLRRATGSQAAALVPRVWRVLLRARSFVLRFLHKINAASMARCSRPSIGFPHFVHAHTSRPASCVYTKGHHTSIIF